MKVAMLFLLISNLFFLQAQTTPAIEQTDPIEILDDSFDDEYEVEEKQAHVFDPLSGYNTVMTNFNDSFYTSVLIPTAKGYDKIIPKRGRESISNFFDNLLFPVRFTNNLLQLKIPHAGEELVRFGINSTVGFFGFFDVAKSHFDLEERNEDFGQTLGHYGVGSGFHIVLPFLGPSNLRDVSGLFVDAIADPLYHFDGRFYNITKEYYEGVAIKSYDILNERSLHVGEYESLKKDALVLYPFLRDLYEQRRKKLIKE